METVALTSIIVWAVGFITLVTSIATNSVGLHSLGSTFAMLGVIGLLVVAGTVAF